MGNASVVIIQCLSITDVFCVRRAVAEIGRVVAGTVKVNGRRSRRDGMTTGDKALYVLRDSLESPDRSRHESESDYEARWLHVR